MNQSPAERSLRTKRVRRALISWTADAVILTALVTANIVLLIACWWNVLLPWTMFLTWLMLPLSRWHQRAPAFTGQLLPLVLLASVFLYCWLSHRLVGARPGQLLLYRRFRTRVSARSLVQWILVTSMLSHFFFLSYLTLR